MGEFEGIGEPMSVKIVLVCGSANIVSMSEVMSLADKCSHVITKPDPQKLHRSLEGNSRVLAAYNPSTRDLVGYLSATLIDGVLNVGWFLVIPGFLPGELPSDMIINMCARMGDVKGIRSNFEIKRYQKIYRDAGMYYNKSNGCWEAIEVYL